MKTFAVQPRFFIGYQSYELGANLSLMPSILRKMQKAALMKALGYSTFKFAVHTFKGQKI